MLIAYHILEFFGRNRFAQVVALEELASHVRKDVVLVLRLNTFSKCRQTEIHGEMDNVLYDGIRSLLVIRLAEEIHVYLENVDRKALKHVEGRIAASKVIHLNDESVAAELFHYGDHLIGISNHDTLSDLHAELLRVKVILLDEALDVFRDIHVVEILWRDVNGDEHIHAAFLPSGEDLAGTAPHVFVDFRDHAVLLDGRNEPYRGKESVILVDPADKGLTSDDVAVTVSYRLEIRPDVAVLDRIVQLRCDLLVPEDLFFELVIVVSQMHGIIVFDGGESDPGVYEHLLGIFHFTIDLINTDLCLDRKLHVIFDDIYESQFLLDADRTEFGFGDKQAEIRAAESPRHALLGASVFQLLSKTLDRIISELGSEDVIYDLEVLNGKIKDHVISILMNINRLLCYLEHLVLVVKSGKPVV